MHLYIICTSVKSPANCNADQCCKIMHLAMNLVFLCAGVRSTQSASSDSDVLPLLYCELSADEQAGMNKPYCR